MEVNYCDLGTWELSTCDAQTCVALTTAGMSEMSTSASSRKVPPHTYTLMCNTGDTASAATFKCTDSDACDVTPSLHCSDVRYLVRHRLHGNDIIVCHWQLECTHHLYIYLHAGFTPSANV